MRKVLKGLLLFLALSGVMRCFAAEVSIRNVTAQQRYPWNGKVDISYEVIGDISARAKLDGVTTAIKVSATDGATGSNYVATALSGDLSLAEGTHSIVWDMDEQGLNILSSDVTFTISCPSETLLYCIVDLSEGPNAASYAVSYTNAAPEEGWSDEFKTRKIVLRRIEAGVGTNFYCGVFEVTQKQYGLVTNSNPSYCIGEMRPVERVSYDAIRGTDIGALYPQTTEVDDNSFMGKLRARTGLAFDLPTADQWEIACRAGTETDFSFGAAPKSQYMWYYSNSSRQSHVVGTKKPNAWGLYDMHGNIWEWCLDWYKEDKTRMLRGGCWSSEAEYCASTNRMGLVSSGSDNRCDGFRVFRTLENDSSSGVLCEGQSAAVKVDLTRDVRTAATTEKLCYSTTWATGVSSEDAVAVVSVDGVAIGSSTGSGVVEWTPIRNGTYTLTHTVLSGGKSIGESLSTVFFATNRVPEKPVISVTNGTIFATSQSIEMTCSSSGATIHYTTDGSVPTLESPVYRRFRIYGRTLIQAIAFYEDGAQSEMAVSECAMGICENPVIIPGDGSEFVHSNETIKVQWDDQDGTLRYTVDGSEPTQSSMEYVGPFKISETTTIRAKVFGDDYFDSQEVTATLVRNWEQVTIPVVAADESFKGSKTKVEISCSVEGAVIHYTLDSTMPDSESPIYTKPFYVTNSCVVMAYATRADYKDSETAVCNITKEWCIGDTMGKPDHQFETGGDAAFARVDDTTAPLGESMRSGVISNVQTSELSTVVMGPGELSFRWKTSCEEDVLNQWDRAVLLVDDEERLVLDGESGWRQESVRIENEGTNVVKWLYVKDYAESAGEDCLWVADYSWSPDYAETQETDTPVPYEWLRAHCPDVVDEYDSYEREAVRTAANCRMTVEQCYVAGLDPQSETDELIVDISIDEDGVPHVTWKPDLKDARTYKVWGRSSLGDGEDWVYPAREGDCFFRVTVEMPEEDLP